MIPYQFAKGEQLECELNSVLNNASDAIVRHRLNLEHPTIQEYQHLERIRNEEEKRLLFAIRDIFGNPFRPVAFDHRWQTSTALGLAQTMYDSRDFGAMPILADALQDAGCEDDDILTHCHGDGPHVRGCWVVDLVLNKS